MVLGRNTTPRSQLSGENSVRVFCSFLLQSFSRLHLQRSQLLLELKPNERCGSRSGFQQEHSSESWLADNNSAVPVKQAALD